TDRVARREQQDGAYALAAERVTHRLVERAELRREHELGQVALDQRTAPVRRLGNPGAAPGPLSRRRASRAAARLRPPSRARRAPAGSRWRRRDPRSARAACVPPRVARAGPPPC